MLRLENITKDYRAGDITVRALKNIDLSFRQNEFVAVLGPSGSGKTTLLNLIGGLDQYTSGDLLIGGKSTKQYRDRDWDVYRNHRVGFVFQSYNLIPHQTVLGNVELSLTIAGINKTERTQRAKNALDEVGLSDQYYKYPNQLSGGQSQRVAIARALVNDPEILLADEPTGALDTKTSLQIMALIKKIAQEKLVIMVTHNAELAEKYSTRIIRLLDGQLQSDSNPFTAEQERKETADIKPAQNAAAALPGGSSAAEDYNGATRQNSAKGAGGANRRKAPRREKAKMSFFTAFKLSLRNLFTKKARTILTSVAGSIGIIGISLVLSISYGVKTFIQDMQNDMLSGNPITVSETAYDLTALMQHSGLGKQKQIMEKLEGHINVENMIQQLAETATDMDNFRIHNNITQQYIDYVLNMPSEYVSAVFLDYGLDVTNNIYTDFKVEADGSGKKTSLSAIQTIYTALLGEAGFASYAGYITSFSDNFMQAFDNEEYILSQYNVLYNSLPEGKLAKEKNQVMIVLDKDSQLTDLLLAQLGYYTQDEFINRIHKAIEDENTSDPQYDPELEKPRFSYEELIGKGFTWYPNQTVFARNTIPAIPAAFTYNPYSEGFSDTDKVDLEVVTILQPKESVSYGSLTSGFYYTQELAQYIIDKNSDSDIAEFAGALDSKSMTNVPPSSPGETSTAILYYYDYVDLNGDLKTNNIGFVGKISAMSAMVGANIRNITWQQLGGSAIPYKISLYPTDFKQKDFVLSYLDDWNLENDITVNGVTVTADEREKIVYTDTLSLIISIINNLVSVVTTALIGFTALALVVSCVMIAIITYVSVVERIKEIGVIRSLGGRKRDVSNLFIAETFIIGLVSGIIGIGVTYLLSFVINLIVGSVSAIGTIAIFPINYALIMLCISIGLTLISGVIPSRSAAKKDPVVALRTE